MSKTPRTDEAQFGTGRVSVDFARTLERELATKDAELAELRGMYEGMKDCSSNANEAAREFADAATRAESERDELRAALASEKDDKDTAIEMLNRRGEILSAEHEKWNRAADQIAETIRQRNDERAHADRLAECLYRTDDAASSVQDWSGTYLGDVLEEASEALTAHEARRKGGAV